MFLSKKSPSWKLCRRERLLEATRCGYLADMLPATLQAPLHHTKIRYHFTMGLDMEVVKHSLVLIWSAHLLSDRTPPKLHLKIRGCIQEAPQISKKCYKTFSFGKWWICEIGHRFLFPSDPHSGQELPWSAVALRCLFVLCLGIPKENAMEREWLEVERKRSCILCFSSPIICTQWLEDVSRCHPNEIESCSGASFFVIKVKGLTKTATSPFPHPFIYTPQSSVNVTSKSS